jgi:hypothetical protein
MELVTLRRHLDRRSAGAPASRGVRDFTLIVDAAPIVAAADVKESHAFPADLAAGRFMVANLELGDYARALDLDRRYAALQLGLAHLSIVILAERFETLRLLSFDERHFRAVRSLGGGPFTILPADA